MMRPIVSSKSIEMGADIRIGDVGQPYILVSLGVVLLLRDWQWQLAEPCMTRRHHYTVLPQKKNLKNFYPNCPKVPKIC